MKACSIPLRRKLEQFDFASVQEASKVYQEQGMPQAEADRRAVDDHIEVLKAQRRRVLGTVAKELGRDTAAGGREMWERFKDGVINQAVTLNQLTDLARTYLPKTAEAFNSTIRRITTAVQETTNRAGPVVSQWHAFTDTEKAALAQLIAESEQAGMRPDLPYEHPANKAGRFNPDNGDPEGEYARLARMLDTMKALNPELAKTYTAQFDQSRDAIRRVVDAQKKLILRTIADPDERDRLMSTLDQQWAAAMNGHPWIPHRWYGEYRVLAWEPAEVDGVEAENLDRDMYDFDTEAEARRAMEQMKAQGLRTRLVLKEDYHRTLQGASNSFKTDVADAIDRAVQEQAGELDAATAAALQSASQELRRTLENLYYASLPEASGARRMIKRKGTGGWQERPENFPRAWAEGVVSMSRLAAKMDHMNQLQTIMEDMTEEAGRRNNVGVLLSWKEAPGVGRKAAPIKSDYSLKVYTSSVEMQQDIESMAASGRQFHAARTEPLNLRTRVEGLVDMYIPQSERAQFLTTNKRYIDEKAKLQRRQPFDPLMAQRYLRAYRNRYSDYLVAAPQNKLANVLTNVGYLNYLGWSPAFAFMNLTQVPVLTLPLLGSKYGYGAATSALGAAAKVMGKNSDVLGKLVKAAFSGAESDVVDLTSLKGVNANQQRMLQSLLDAGKLDFTQSSELHSITAGSPVGWQRIIRSAGWLSHPTEVGNRIVTALAAYDLASQKSQASSPESRHAEAVKAAIRAVDDSQLDYSQENQPRVLRIPIARVALQFRQFQQQVTWMLGRALSQALKGESPEVRREALKYLIGVTTMTTVLAGVRGAPFMGAWLLLASMLGGDDDDPYDAELALRQTVGNSLYDGVFSALGVSVGRSVGLGDLMPGTGGGVSLARTNQERFREAVVDALGPAASMGVSWSRAMDHFERGDALKGWEAMLPRAFKAGVAAYREQTQGIVANNGTVRIAGEDIPAHTFVTSLLGLRSQKVDIVQSKVASVNAREQLLGARAALLRRQYLMAREAGDTEEEVEVLAAIERFNAANPFMAVTGRSIASKARAEARAQAFADLTEGMAQNRVQLQLAEQLGLLDDL